MRIKELRAINGPNIYSYHPIIKLVVDLEDYEGVSSKEIKNFNKKLMNLLPSLEEHHCSLGRKGGFIERLKEGTYLGHVIEHIALELLVLVGQDVYYGKTRRFNNSGVYNIIFEYKTKETALSAAQYSFDIVNKLTQNKKIDLDYILTKLKKIERQAGLGPSTKAIIEAAQEEELPIMRLGDKNSLLQIGYGQYSKLIQATINEGTSCIGVDISCNKVQTRRILEDMGLPVPYGKVVETLEEAVTFQQRLGTKVITKPINGNQGKGVSLDLETEVELKAGMDRAQNYSQKVLIEEYLTGKDYRLLVVGNEVVAASQRIPAHIEGDGQQTIRELIKELNNDPRRGEGHEKPLTKVRIDTVIENNLAKNGYSLNSIPKQGEIVYLEQTANLSTGGIAVDCTDKVHPDNSKLAIRAAKIIGLDIAGIDIVTSDITQPITKAEGAIIEINAAPGIRMHHYPSKGKSRNVAKSIINFIAPSRIPIISVTGTNGKTTTSRMINAILREADIKVGLATTGGIYINDDLVLEGDTTGPLSAQTVLRDKDVEAAILETARGGILRDGLGYDWSDIGIITNITNDHLGQNGITNLEDLADVKSLVIERVKKYGYVILNADDEQVVRLAERSNTDQIIYCSLDRENIMIQKQIINNRPAVYLKEDNLTLFDGEDELPILATEKLPAAHNGLAYHILENALFAVAASFAYGIPTFMIRSALQNFGNEIKDNPGRLNVITNDKFTAIIDYGHNPAGYQATLDFAQQLAQNELIGVIGVPGDREDQIIQETGKVAGEYLDKVIIKEDYNLRGRKEGEVARLLKEGVLESGLKDIKIELFELEAIKKALNQVQKDDVIVIFYEKGLDDILKLVTGSELEISDCYELLG